MSDAVVSLTKWEDLSQFVHRTLCQQDQLDEHQTPLIRTLLMKRGQPCGVLFHIEGPRVLRTSAIWAAEENRLLFYDSRGERYRTVRLSEAPDLSQALPKAVN